METWPFYDPHSTRQTANSQLLVKAAGSFVLRPSSVSGELALSVNSIEDTPTGGQANMVQHTKIFRRYGASGTLGYTVALGDSESKVFDHLIGLLRFLQPWIRLERPYGDAPPQGSEEAAAEEMSEAGGQYGRISLMPGMGR